MKKIYILAALVAFTFSANAQIFEDGLEDYNLGDMVDQNPNLWSVWSGDPTNGPESLDIVDDIVRTGSQSGFVGPGAGPQDILLLLGNRTSGDYTLQFYMYINPGMTGYFNIQGETEDPGTGFQGAGNGGAGVYNSGNITFNDGGGNPGIVVDAANGEELSYPEGEWFPVQLYFDIDNLEYTMTVAGDQGPATAFQEDTTLGGIDFFAIDGNNEYWIDDVTFVDGELLSTDDFSASNFSVYPNPVQNVLNIKSANAVDAVVVYDVLGKVVLSTNPGAVSPSVDMSSLTSGAYLVNITIDGASKTVKVVK
ncbi:T9SS type A sorting domain-containing protein [Marinirhabdus gelatinilytica]|uniref:Putative secreted protein (Por secretion system target) n=1 Tax=Marinirhabdus gelatinilytica TaxID=1703343 RepID=A0A370Q8Q1_9FLAO|nr:T9SS type A sorting domain-containing protein [Marinirhabdus gelatinilytica]RDK84735.1 putative secreted protein (Por secretion system target) [Marinirhabdus gelatinilytica]